jgi:sulfite reductase alpha subunit-like flavoprotein
MKEEKVMTAHRNFLNFFDITLNAYAFRLEDDWIQWKTAFLRRISEKHGGNNQMSVSFIPSFKLVMCDQSFDEILFSPKSRESKLRKSSLTSSGNESTPFYSKLKARKDLRNLDSSSSKLNDTSSYMHYEFEIPQYMSYKTADNFGIFPANDHESVARLAKRFNYILSETFKLESITEQCNQHFIIRV